MPLAHHHQLDARPADARWVAPRNGEPPSGAVAETLRRAELLLPQDRAIVEMTLRNRVTRQDIARTLGIAAGTVTRRLQRLSARLHDPLVVALLDAGCPLAPEYRQVGVEHFLQGLPVRHIADKHRIAEAQVRAMVGVIRQWHGMVRKGRTED